MDFSSVPANRQFGFRFIERTHERTILAMDPNPDYKQEEGILHGGVISALADTAAVYCFHPGLQADEMMTSVEFKMNFLRPALFDLGELIATARVIQRGRKIGVCEVEVTQGQKLIAKGIFTYLFYKRSE